jgi:hypothetical protein
LPSGPAAAGNYVIPTREGVYNPDTGTPLATEGDFWKAHNLWKDEGFSEPRWVISKFYRHFDLNKTYPVIFSSSPGHSDGGPATILLNKPFELQEDLFNRKFIHEVSCSECGHRRSFPERIIGSFAAKEKWQGI